MSLIHRFMHLRQRVLWMRDITGSSWSALMFWMAASRNSDHICIGKYRGTEMVFRGLDTMAIKEILVDKEYASVVRQLAHIDAPVVLDIGSHIGLFSLLVLKENPQAQVLSVEADPQTYNILIRNAAALRSQGAGWDTINAAAWGEEGEQLSFEESGPSMSHRVSSSGKVFVTSTTFKSLMDRLLARHDVIDMLKVDIEGSEESFLCASPELLRHVRCVVIELHPHLCNAERVRDVLKQVYGTVAEVHDRTSSKPLLICY